MLGMFVLSAYNEQFCAKYIIEIFGFCSCVASGAFFIEKFINVFVSA